MVTIIWLILSLVGVCSFSWWPMLIEALVLLILTAVVTLGHPEKRAFFFMVTMGGICRFCGGKTLLWPVPFATVAGGCAGLEFGRAGDSGRLYHRGNRTQ